MACPLRPKTPFYRFNASPEIIRLVVMMYVKFPLSLRNVEDLVHERGIDLCHETVRFRPIKTLQKFASVHGSVTNHFNQERNLIKGTLQGEMLPGAGGVARGHGLNPCGLGRAAPHSGTTSPPAFKGRPAAGNPGGPS